MGYPTARLGRLSRWNDVLVSADYRLAPQVGIQRICDDVEDCTKFTRDPHAVSSWFLLASLTTPSTRSVCWSPAATRRPPQVCTSTSSHAPCSPSTLSVSFDRNWSKHAQSITLCHLRPSLLPMVGIRCGELPLGRRTSCVAPPPPGAAPRCRSRRNLKAG